MLLSRHISVAAAAMTLLAALLLSSCSGSRKFARDPIYDAGKEKSGSSHKKPVTAGRRLDRPSRDLVEEAGRWLGTRYVYGGHSRSGTDCSGFVMEVYRNAADIKLPRTTSAQRDFCKSVKKSDLDVGDLVFFTSRKGKGKVSHVGLYVGDGKMIHASASKGVIVSALDERYYVTNYHSAGRVASFRKEKSAKADSPSAVSPAGVRPKKNVIEVRADELDSLLNHKIDSIYTDMMD